MRAIHLACLAFLVGGSASAQLTLHVSFGGVRDQLGSDVRAAGDVNNDGTPDVVIGTNSSGADYARVLSGLDGSILHAFAEPANRLGFARYVAGGIDRNSDGFADLLVASKSSGIIDIYSGQDGTPLGQVQGPANIGFDDMCVVGDMDGDSSPDFAYAYRNNGAAITVCSGRTGAQIHNFPLAQQRQLAIRDAGDVDNDGITDLVAVQARNGTSFAGFVRVYSGRTGSILRDTSAPQLADFMSVDGVGDLDVDGYADYAVGSPREFDPTTGYSSGIVRVYSGRSGLLLHRVAGSPGSQLFGNAVCGAGDVNADGVPDFAVGDPSGQGGSVQVFSGFSGAEVMRLDGASASAQLGASLDLAGDVDGDGLPDLVVGAPGHSPRFSSQGCARLVSGEILAWTTKLGRGCGGGPFLPVLASTRPQLGQSVTVVGQQVPAMASGGVLVLGLPAVVPLNLGVPDCDLFVAPGSMAVLQSVPATSWSIGVALPSALSFKGLDVALQAIYSPTQGPLGYDLSNALVWRLGG